MYRKEKKVTFFKIQLHNYSVLTYKFYTNIHERVVNTQIHPSTHLFLKKLQSKVNCFINFNLAVPSTAPPPPPTTGE